MISTSIATNRYPGAVPALLAWVDGDTERLGTLVTTFCAEAPSLVRSISRDLETGSHDGLPQKIARLQKCLEPFGVPQLRAAAASLGDLCRLKEWGQLIPLVEEMQSLLNGFCGYLTRKPWLRY